MCWTMSRMLQDDWLDANTNNHKELYLKRGIMDPEQSIALFMGLDDLSHNHFQVIPESFGRNEDRIFALSE